MAALAAIDAGRREVVPNSSYELFVLGISLLAVALLVVEFAVPLAPETRRLIHWVDHGLCALFFADFVRRLSRAPDRWRYLRTAGWLDLLSSIPYVEAFRLARLARMVRVVRAIRLLLLSHRLGRRLREHPRSNAVLTAAFVCGAVVAVGAAAVLEAERGRGNIVDAGDALWWAITTITTVGYGDFTPVTPAGRAIGVLLMLVGVGTFGVLAGLLASVLVRVEEGAGAATGTPAPAGESPAAVEARLASLTAEVQAMAGEVARLREELARTRDGAPLR